MGILKLHSAYTPRKNPNRRISIANKVQLNIKFEEPKPQRYDGRRRSNSVDAATFARENRVHELRERRAPERFVPENFLIKAKEVRRQRRNSTTTAIEMQREAFKSSRSSFDMKQLEDRFLKIDKMTRCHSKNLPRKTPVETEKFVKSLFVDNMTGIIGESKMLLIKYEEMGGLIHLKPKAKRSVRTVDEGNDLVSVLSFIFTICIFSMSISLKRKYDK